MTISRAYNSFRHIPHGLIEKTSTTPRLADEIDYYYFIQDDFQKAGYFPRVAYAHKGIENQLVLERYPYNNLGQELFYHDPEWTDIFTLLLEVFNLWDRFVDPAPPPVALYEMYIEKTYTEFNNLVKERRDLQHLFEAGDITINGNTYINFLFIWDRVINCLHHMTPYKSVMIHGDCCFSNILYGGEDVVKFVDPRGSFGKLGIYGDRRYDIAKLLHSLDGHYEFFIYDKFKIEQIGPKDYSLTFDAYAEQKQVDALKIFRRMFFVDGKYNEKEIKLIEGCIFIGMCARHYDSKDRQLAMYLTGIRILNEALAL